MMNGSVPGKTAIVLTAGQLESAVAALWTDLYPLDEASTVDDARRTSDEAKAISDGLWSILTGVTPAPTRAPRMPRARANVDGGDWFSRMWQRIVGRP